jgi:hypothetical protein
MRGTTGDILSVAENKKQDLGKTNPDARKNKFNFKPVQVGGKMKTHGKGKGGNGEAVKHDKTKLQCDEATNRLINRLLNEECCQIIMPGAGSMKTDFYDQDEFKGDMKSVNPNFRKTNKDFWGESEDVDAEEELEEDFDFGPPPPLHGGMAPGPSRPGKPVDPWEDATDEFDPWADAEIEEPENDFGFGVLDDGGDPWAEQDSMPMRPPRGSRDPYGYGESKKSRRPNWLGEELDQDTSGTGGINMPEQSTDKWNKGSGSGEKNSGGVDLGSEDQSEAPDFDDEDATEEKGSQDLNSTPWGKANVGGTSESTLPKSFQEWMKNNKKK